jgi:Sir2 family
MLHVFSLLKFLKIRFIFKTMDNMPDSEQWELLEKVVTSEAVAQSIYKSLFSTHRNKLPNINTFEDVLELIKSSNNIVILTGAGVSVSCGIPDFRSPGGKSRELKIQTLTFTRLRPSLKRIFLTTILINFIKDYIL